MPVVPNVPGVPALSSYDPDPPDLLIADLVGVVGLVVPPLWGIYANGTPVITPASPLSQQLIQTLGPIADLASIIGVPNLIPSVASTIDFEYRQDWPISDYPQENGAFQSYDKVQLPYDVRVKLASGGSDSARQAFLSSCLSVANSLALFDVVTPEMPFTSCSVSHIEWRRQAQSGVTLIMVDMWFKQIRITSTATFGNTASPTVAGQQNIGTVQGQEGGAGSSGGPLRISTSSTQPPLPSPTSIQ